MKYIKLFEDYINEFFINHDSNEFSIDGINFIVKFVELEKNGTKYWIRSYGAIKDGELDDSELGLGIMSVYKLISEVTKITNNFIIKNQPDILYIEHKDMDNEKFVPSDQLNKRARLNYRYLYDIIPNNYVLTYWSNNNTYQNEDSKSSTTCIIYRRHLDDWKMLKPLVEHKIRIII